MKKKIRTDFFLITAKMCVYYLFYQYFFSFNKIKMFKNSSDELEIVGFCGKFYSF